MTQSQFPKLSWALGHMSEFQRYLSHRELAIFLDYDGTLAPLSPMPQLAVPSSKIKNTLAILAELCSVAIISGRSRESIHKLLGLDNLIYAGSHGLDIAGPEGSGVRIDVGAEFFEVIREVAMHLSEELRDIRGCLVEQTTYTVSVHYRLVSDNEVMCVKDVLHRTIKAYKALHITYGKKILVVRPKLDWDKGSAMSYIMESLNLDRKFTLSIYVGDDLTDEDAFRELEGQGIGILVSTVRRKTSATHFLRDTGEVQMFLDGMVSLLSEYPCYSF